MIADLASVILAICAIAVVADYFLGSRMGDDATLRRESVRVADWEQYAVGRRVGPDSAPVVIIEWGDYQCPVCRWFDEHIRAATNRFPNEVAVVYRHWPLGSHQYAYPAARAAECAADQGRFEEFHHALYAEPNWLGDAFLRFAEESGVPDLGTFQTCIDSSEPVVTIERDIRAVRDLGGLGTPTLLVNDLLLATTPDSLTLFALIEDALENAGHLSGR